MVQDKGGKTWQVNWAGYYYYTLRNGLFHSEYNTSVDYLAWIEDFSAFESWFHHEFYPDDTYFNGSGYEFGSINMYNKFLILYI